MANPIGTVIHFYNRISVAVLALDAELKVGEWVQFLGYSTDFEQPVESLEINHHKLTAAAPGEEVAMKVIDRVRAGDKIYRVVPEIQ